MPRTANNWKIDGLHPAEYAQQWGSGTRDGARFYNCADVDRYTGETCSNPDWDSEDWRAFAQTAREYARARTGEDSENLARLAEWGEYMAGRADSSLPWLNRTV